MIIRSQDKKKILNFEHIRKISIDANMIMADDVFVIGTYSTEEKAIKVLDMIQDAYARCESTKELASGILLEAAKCFTQNEAEEFKKDHRGNFIFQMPSNESVEVKNE